VREKEGGVLSQGEGRGRKVQRSAFCRGDLDDLEPGRPVQRLISNKAPASLDWGGKRRSVLRSREKGLVQGRCGVSWEGEMAEKSDVAG